MKLTKIDISFNDTDDISINVWLPGCKLNCHGCFSQQLKDFNFGQEIELNKVVEMVKGRMGLTNTVCILGGNPPDNKDLEELVREIKKIGAIIWVYSGYDFDDIKNMAWVNFCDYIKAGPYREDLVNKDYRWASTNQNLYHKNDCGKWEIVEAFKCLE